MFYLPRIETRADADRTLFRMRQQQSRNYLRTFTPVFYTMIGVLEVVSCCLVISASCCASEPRRRSHSRHNPCVQDMGIRIRLWCTASRRIRAGMTRYSDYQGVVLAHVEFSDNCFSVILLAFRSYAPEGSMYGLSQDLWNNSAFPSGTKIHETNT